MIAFVLIIEHKSLKLNQFHEIELLKYLKQRSHVKRYTWKIHESTVWWKNDDVLLVFLIPEDANISIHVLSTQDRRFSSFWINSKQRVYDTSRVMFFEIVCFSFRRAIRDSEIKKENFTSRCLLLSSSVLNLSINEFALS
jgi:hypothetical protein